MYICKRVAVVVFAFVLFSCATGGQRGSDTPLFYGYGTGTTVTQSLNAAKQDILRQVIEIILSTEILAAKSGELDMLFYSTEQPNAYLLKDSIEILSQGKEDDKFYSRIGVRVDLKAVVRTLEGNFVYGGMVEPGADIRFKDREPPSVAQTETAQEETATNPEQNAIIGAYLDSLTFLVYFNAEAEVDPFLMKAAAGIANRYLSEQGIYLIDLDTVETIKRDQELAYEAQTGETVSLIQWIAQKLNADIYIEIDAETTSETKDGKYYGQANITLKFFNSSTAALLASATYRSPRTFSSSSELDALNNAIQSSVYQAMPGALDQVYVRMETTAMNGIPYDLIILRPPDSRIMRDFMGELQLRAEKVQLVSMSADEVRYRVYLIGAVEDLQDIVFDIADFIPQLRSLELVYLRGKSITFTGGL